MSIQQPEGILCSKSHEWVLDEGDTYKIGLTDYAVEQLGDIVFVELPEVESEFAKGEVFATIESVKAASEIYMPIGGKIVEVNEELVREKAKENTNWHNPVWRHEDGTIAEW